MNRRRPSHRPGLYALALLGALAASPAHSSTGAAPPRPANGDFLLMSRDLPFLAAAPRPKGECGDTPRHGLCGADRFAWGSLRLDARHALETGYPGSARLREEAALRLATAAGDADRMLAGEAALALVEATEGATIAALGHLDAAHALATNAPPAQALELAEFVATVHAALGHERQALDAIAAGLDAAAALHRVRDTIFLLALRARLEVVRGELMPASRDITRATSIAGGAMRAHADRALRLDRGLLDIATGRQAQGTADVDALLRELAGEGATAVELDVLRALALAQERLGDTAAAHATALRAEDLAGRADGTRLEAHQETMQRGATPLAAVPAPAADVAPADAAMPDPASSRGGAPAGVAIAALAALALFAARRRLAGWADLLARRARAAPAPAPGRGMRALLRPAPALTRHARTRAAAPRARR